MEKMDSLSLLYSDAELYDKMGFAFPPSDRELEVRILSLMRTYGTLGQHPNPTLYLFFDKVYDHFFGQEDEYEDKDKHEHEDKDEDEDKDKEAATQEGFVSTIPRMAAPAAKQTPMTSPGTGLLPESAVSVVSNIPYTRDKMNPLLKQTIQRVVSIDSKYRNIFSGKADTVNTLKSNSTNFTIDLSEPLKDVLSIKLYSFQIPNAWYTIAKNFGSNFLLLRGNSPGIDTGNFDYKVEIASGTYTAKELIEAVSNSIQKLKKTYTDVSFGVSDISMNPANSVSSLTWDFTNPYDQSYYYLDWGLTPNPDRNNNTTGTATYFDIPSFLGFNNRTYPLSSLVSLPFKYNQSEYTTDNSYKINSNNSTITIQTLNTEGVVDFSFNISLDITEGASRKALVNNINEKISQSDFLDTTLSSVSLVPPSPADNSDAFFKFDIFFDKKRVKINMNQIHTYEVIFPEEVGDNIIWTGKGSAFQFTSVLYKNTLNNATSENSIINNSFEITNNPPIIEFKPDKDIIPFYVDSSYNSNDLKFVCNNLTKGFYTLNQFETAVNATCLLPVADPHFNIILPNAKQPDFPFVRDSSPFELTFDFNIIFGTNEYYIDLSHSVLEFLFYKTNKDNNNGPLLIDLSLNNNISSTLTNKNLATLKIPVDLSGNLFRIKPKYRRNGCLATDASNQTFTMTSNDVSGIQITVPFKSSLKEKTTLEGIEYYVYSNLQNNNQLWTDINNSIQQPQPLDYKVNIYDTQFTYELTQNQEILMTLIPKVKVVIGQDSYQVSLYDLSNGESSCWNSFGFDSTPYKLPLFKNNTYSSILAQGNTSAALLQLDAENSRFYFRPYNYANGLSTTAPGEILGTYFNDISIEIDIGEYNTSSLITAINNALKNNPLTKGSTFSYIPSGSTVQYAQFKINILKTFTAKDFSLVLYNPVSFYQCYSVDTSIRSTTWDTTMGWILGYRQVSYPLSDYLLPNSSVAVILGENTVNVNLFSYLLITLDDFNQCRLNDGLVSITKPDSSVSLPYYANLSQITCVDGANVATGSTNTNSNNLTMNQTYALNQVLAARSTPISQTFSQGPFIKDVFGIVPLKVSGLKNADLYTDYGGSLGTQERVYFGPVNIRRLQVTLYNNQGTIMDLNNADWSFSFVCEQLYQQNSGDPSKKT